METTNHTTRNPVENVLSGFYKNAAVGAHSISSLLPEVEDMKLRRELFAQRDYYEAQKASLRTQMAEIFLEPLEAGKAAQYWTDMVIRCKAKMGMTTEMAAKLMVEGTNMGMVQLHQVLNHNPNIPDDLRAQGGHILAHEREYLDRITPYL
ncbi:MAG: hypothetical protein II916_08585 [Oscillospiraceae bacterium]|nr:hypothetical protein [Oscillospiraceae bacterium]